MHPYPETLTIVTKVGARRGADASWIRVDSRQELIDAIHDNLRNLGVDALDVVNFRAMGGVNGHGMAHESIDAQVTTLAEFRCDDVATTLQVTPMQVALAWLLQRSPNILLIPGTSSVAHLRENLSVATLELSADSVARLNAIGTTRSRHTDIGNKSPTRSSVLAHNPVA